MRTIMVMNPKGGCGKTTLATNLASHYANAGKKTALADFDPQHSSLDWLAIRPEQRPTIQSIDAVNHGLRSLDEESTDIFIIDAPARVHGSELLDLTHRAETILVPVLPSPVDIFAAQHFADDLEHAGIIERKEAKVGLVANRVRESTLIAHDLGVFLERMKLPIIGKLREAQNYIRAFARGIGVAELAPYQGYPDVKQWEPIIRWLKSRRSRP